MDNAVGSTRTIGEIRVDESSSPGTTLDRDLVFQTSRRPAVRVGVAALHHAGRLPGRQRAGADGPGRRTRRFVNLAARDLHLTGQSPAIDAADTATDGLDRRRP